MKNKLSKIEIIVLSTLALTILSIGSCSYQIHKAGGIKNIIIETGKEIKDIQNQINEEK